VGGAITGAVLFARKKGVSPRFTVENPPASSIDRIVSRPPALIAAYLGSSRFFEAIASAVLEEAIRSCGAVIQHHGSSACARLDMRDRRWLGGGRQVTCFDTALAPSD
jgi:hypothetical protein